MTEHRIVGTPFSKVYPMYVKKAETKGRTRAPACHPNAVRIKGVVCGIRVGNIEDPLMRKLRYLDKLIDELAKGKAMDKILRT